MIRSILLNWGIEWKLALVICGKSVKVFGFLCLKCGTSSK